MSRTTVDRYAVMGNPIAHSKSPRIHTLFAEQTGQAIAYDAILVPEDGFSEALAAFERDGGRGVNVTIPFKEEAWALVDKRSARAELAGAVNTVSLGTPEGRVGDNTDGVGLVRDLQDNHGVSLGGREVLVIGAGGAVRGVLGPLLETGPRRVTLANRTVSRAHELTERFRHLGSINACGFDQLAGAFDVIINGTSLSLQDEVPPLPDTVVNSGSCLYDMMYAARPTAFVRWGEARGAGQSLDGLGMLVEQAAESFFVWRGVRAQSQPVIERLRGEMAAAE